MLDTVYMFVTVVVFDLGILDVLRYFRAEEDIAGL